MEGMKVRLIDADALNDYVLDAYGGGADNNTVIWYGDVLSFINEAPSVDTVPVVRCRECRNRYTTHCSMYYECDKCGGQWDWTSDDDFCSYGEKKETQGEA